MRRSPFAALLLAALLAGCAAASAPQSAERAARPPKDLPPPAYAPRFEPAGCPFDSGGERVECGYLLVPEDRAHPERATLKLALAIVRSRAADPAPDPIVYLEGGPGGGTVYDPEFWYESPLRDRRDIILLDQRGTGYSLPSLNCPEMESPDVVTNSDDVRAARACRARLAAAGVDLRQYTSAAGAADVADLRVALGLDQLNLLGVSYGTRLALTVLRDRPAGIRSVVLDSVYPPQADSYTESAANAAAAFEALFAGCAADPACDGAYPDLGDTFYRLVARLNREPADLELRGADGQPYTETFDGDDLVDELSFWLYDTWLIPELPRAIWRAAEGEYDALVELLEGGGWAAPEIPAPAPGMIDTGAADLGDMTDAEGVFFSVECREELPFGDLEAAEREVAAYPVEVRPMLMASLRHTARICGEWGVGRALAVESRPVASDVPALLLAGAYDPVTPPRWAEDSAAHLSRATLLTFPAAGHGVVFAETCAEQIVAAFIDDPAAPPDAACHARLAGPEFVTP